MTAVSSGSEQIAALDLTGIPTEKLVDWLRQMWLIRLFELACDPLAMQGKIASAVHTAVGQEAVAVGSIAALASADAVVGAHRTHHHAIAKGMDLGAIMAEFFGKVGGCCQGRGGEIHISDPHIGYLGGTAMVGTGVGIGMGFALGCSLQKNGRIALSFVGDGGLNTGRTWEHLNLAALWKLPLIVVCENNKYAVTSDYKSMTAGGSATARAIAFGVPAITVDGQDVCAVYRAAAAARERALAGEGPSFIEAVTYRFLPHSTGQDNAYRTSDEIEYWRTNRDPIVLLTAAMRRADLLSESEVDEVRSGAEKAVSEAVLFAEESPLPPPEKALEDVTFMDVRIRTNEWRPR
jgi:TPP-dependent pyruvate/acetoin dehydrogenase alpha subunit